MRLTLVLPALVAAAPLSGQGRLAVREEPGGTAVGVALAFRAESEAEDATEAGLTHLAAQAALEEVRPRIQPFGALLTLVCDRAAIVFTLAAPASGWTQATSLLIQALARGEVGEEAVERARAGLIAASALEAGSPAHEVRVALEQARFGDEHPWARPVCGRQARLGALSAEDVRRVLAARFAPGRAAAGVAGPVATARARAFFSRALGAIEAPPPRPGSPAAEPAAGTRMVERRTITSWVGLSYPAAPDADTEALRLLAFYLQETVRPSPAQDEVYDAAAELERHGSGSLTLYMAVEPAQASAVVERVRATVRRAAAEPLSPSRFEEVRRRFRGVRLLGLAAPEARAREAAQQLLFEGSYRPAAERVELLDAEAVRRAAATLGEPAVVILGPRPSAPRPTP